MAQLRLKWKFMLVFSLVLALMFASYRVIHSYIMQQSQVIEQQRAATMEWVLVFQRDIEAGEVVTLSDLQQRKYPPSYISDEWLRPEDATAIIGSELLHFVSAGAPVMVHQLRQPRASTFADRLAENEYAITVSVGIEQLHHGLLQVGNRVALVASEVFSTTGKRSLMTLMNIEVLAIDQATSSAAGSRLATTLTLRFTHEEAILFEQFRRTGFALWLQRPEQEYTAPLQPSEIQVYELSGQGVSQQ